MATNGTKVLNTFLGHHKYLAKKIQFINFQVEARPCHDFIFHLCGLGRLVGNGWELRYVHRHMYLAT